MRKQGMILVAVVVTAGLSMALTGPSPSRGQSDRVYPSSQSAHMDDQLSYRHVERVYVEPLAKNVDGRNARIRVDLGARSEPVFPSTPRAGDLSSQPGGATRSVTIDLGLLEEGQARYAEDLKSDGQVVEYAGRVPRVRQASIDGYVYSPLTPGREQALVPYQGSPKLSQAEEARLISHCLMITDLGVVEDPERTTGNGRWTFGQLMTKLANEKETGLKPAVFVRKWLDHWVNDQDIDGFKVPNRKAGIQSLIIDPWPKLADGSLDLSQAPFRLLAIVSRVDLRNNLVLGAERIGGGGAGEARFVFCAVAPDRTALPFTVIFEFGVKKHDFASVKEWARKWYALKDLDLGSDAYNEALEQLTGQFSDAGIDPESPPNRSGLSQLRTNEIALTLPPGVGPPLWEIREFRLDVQDTGLLRQVTVKQTPDLTLNGTPVVAGFVNFDEGPILAQRHRTPLDFPPGSPLLGAAAATPPNTFWNGPAGTIHAPEARHLFSLGTCNGCHAREAFPTFTAGDNLLLDQPPPHFTQVRPRQAGKEARLSAFLTGKDAAGNPFELPDPANEPDPADPSRVKTRHFGDLPRRAHDLRNLIRYGAYYESHRLPLQMVH